MLRQRKVSATLWCFELSYLKGAADRLHLLAYSDKILLKVDIFPA